MKLDPEPARMAAVMVYDPSDDEMAYYSCVALNRCTSELPYGTSKYLDAYRQYFSPDVIDPDGYWGKRKANKWQHQRSIALLLLAEMAETGDL